MKCDSGQTIVQQVSFTIVLGRGGNRKDLTALLRIVCWPVMERTKISCHAEMNDLLALAF